MAHPFSGKKIHFVSYDAIYCDHWSKDSIKKLIEDAGGEYATQRKGSDIVVVHEDQKTTKVYQHYLKNGLGEECYSYDKFSKLLGVSTVSRNGDKGDFLGAILYDVADLPNQVIGCNIIHKLYRMEVVAVLGGSRRYFRVAEGSGSVDVQLVWQPQKYSDLENPEATFLTQFRELTGKHWKDRHSRERSKGAYRCAVISPSNKLEETWDEVLKTADRSPTKMYKKLQGLLETSEEFLECQQEFEKRSLKKQRQTELFRREHPTSDPPSLWTIRQIKVSLHLLQ